MMMMMIIPAPIASLSLLVSLLVSLIDSFDVLGDGLITMKLIFYNSNDDDNDDDDDNNDDDDT